ncbi:Mitogen-activated protein kinase kinase 2 [Diplonema papillatum]|nr:Mitogen-activated protein kinase kinase 2 [Diplonema papillatum]
MTLEVGKTEKIEPKRKGGKFKPPEIKIIARDPPAKPPVTTNCWTKSGAFVLRNGNGGAIKVTPDGVLKSSALNIGWRIKFDNLIYQRTLGQGASGVVRLAEDKETKQQYAVKAVAYRYEARRVFEEETKRLLDDSPYTVRLLQACVRDQKLILIQEFMEFGSLHELLLTCRTNKIRIPETIISVLTRQILQGLAYLHQKNDSTHSRAQMHRDLKPGNILINKKGQCKLADFGVMVEVATLGQSSFIGTPPYMSPERIKGLRYGTPGDIWAVGLIVAEMSRGTFPFCETRQFLVLLNEITTATSISLPDASEDLNKFVHSLIKQDPGQRPTASDALELPFIKV